MQHVSKLVSKKELKSIYGIPYCFAHIARLEAAGEFPARVMLGACRVAWFAEEVEAWIAEPATRSVITLPFEGHRAPGPTGVLTFHSKHELKGPRNENV